MIPAIPDCPDETTWHRHWSGMFDGGLPGSAELALRGGARADRLAWVFASGYQGALRCVFPEFTGSGTCCLAVAEPKEGPACVLAPAGDVLQLSGVKSWIAGSATLSHLVVGVGRGEDVRFVRVDRRAPGLALSQPRTPSFLAELSQGAARFEAVDVADPSLLDAPVRLHWFRAAEPLHVLLALNACLAAHAQTAEPDAAAQVRAAAAAACIHGSALTGSIGDRTLMRSGLEELRALTRETVRSFESGALQQAMPSLQRSWVADAKLPGMFGVAADRV